MRNTSFALLIALSSLLWPIASSRGAGPDAPRVQVLRVPDGGIQPQAAIDEAGTVHVVWFRGEPAGGDLFHAMLRPGSERFTEPVRVNSQPGSAIAMGTIRGAQLAIGGGRVHVCWNGSNSATPKNPTGSNPMLYSRSNPAATAFEPQRNLMKRTSALDGGGTVAADKDGRVLVAWHGRAEDAADGEAGRRLYVARSSDSGATFADESPAIEASTGACPCCGTKALADDRGRVYILYRMAGEKVNRGMYLLASDDRGDHFRGGSIHPWKIDACPMSSASLASGKSGVVAAWETGDRVFFARVDPETARVSEPIAPPGGRGRKHPSVATGAKGETLLAWAEGTGWQRGGALVWQVFDRDGRPTDVKGRLAGGIPVWSLPTAVARPDGSFLILH